MRALFPETLALLGRIVRGHPRTIARVLAVRFGLMTEPGATEHGLATGVAKIVLWCTATIIEFSPACLARRPVAIRSGKQMHLHRRIRPLQTVTTLPVEFVAEPCRELRVECILHIISSLVKVVVGGSTRESARVAIVCEAKVALSLTDEKLQNVQGRGRQLQQVSLDRFLGKGGSPVGCLVVLAVDKHFVVVDIVVSLFTSKTETTATAAKISVEIEFAFEAIVVVDDLIEGVLKEDLDTGDLLIGAAHGLFRINVCGCRISGLFSRVAALKRILKLTSSRLRVGCSAVQWNRIQWGTE